MFPTATRPATCPDSGRNCSCDICQPIHCPDCAQNFAYDAQYQLVNTPLSPPVEFPQANLAQHIRQPCCERHTCGYCQGRFIRRVDLIEHYESGVCAPLLDRAINPTTAQLLETTPLLPTTVHLPPAPAPLIATQQSWNAQTGRFKCYLCNPVKLGFPTLTGLNEHLADPEHQAKRYQCPHLACNIPLDTIAGLVQHIELRSCRCMTDSKWWNSYFAIHTTWAEPQPVTAMSFPVRIQADLDLEEYQMRRYLEMTGFGGRWVYTRGLFSRVGRYLAIFVGILVGGFLGLVASALLLVLVVFEIVRPFFPALVMLALLAVAGFFVFQLLSFVLLVVFEFVLRVTPDVIEYLRHIVELVVSVVSTGIQDIIDFVAGIIGRVTGGL